MTNEPITVDTGQFPAFHNLIQYPFPTTQEGWVSELHPYWNTGEMTLERAGLELARSYHRDLTRLFDRLTSEANDRDWCDEYGYFLNDLRPSLFFPVPEYTESRCVEILLTVNITAERSKMEDTLEQYRHHLYSQCDNPSLTATTDVTVIDVEDARVTNDGT